jgi:AAA15 family ATPase/GTPase
LFDEESNGTKKIFSVIPRLIRSLLKGKTFVADELDAKLHPKLLKYIIELFTDKQINTKNAQLIFTSHDLYTMDNDIFRRDEIWFAAKNAEQATSLYSLVEFKDKTTGKSVRNDANFNKQYLEGRYGADPYLRKIVNWEAVISEE